MFIDTFNTCFYWISVYTLFARAGGQIMCLFCLATNTSPVKRTIRQAVFLLQRQKPFQLEMQKEVGVVQDTTKGQITVRMKVNDCTFPTRHRCRRKYYNATICLQTPSMPVKRKIGYVEWFENDAKRCDNTCCDKHNDWRNPLAYLLYRKRAC